MSLVTQLERHQVDNRAHVGNGSFSNVFDGGDYVVKVPMSWTRRYTLRQRIRVATEVVLLTMRLREALGPIVPLTWYGAGGFIMQAKVSGKRFYDLMYPHDRPAYDGIGRCIQDAKSALEAIQRDSWIDTNEANFFFTPEGKLLHWFDPIAPRWRWA